MSNEVLALDWQKKIFKTLELYQEAEGGQWETPWALRLEIIKRKHRLQTTAMLTLGYAVESNQDAIPILKLSFFFLFVTDAESTWLHSCNL